VAWRRADEEDGLMGWLPIGGNMAPATSAPVVIGGLLVGDSTPSEITLASLANWSRETYEVSGRYAAELGIGGVNVDATVDSRILVYDFTNYVDVGKEQNGRKLTERWGIAVRLTLTVLNLKGSFGLDMAGVAAKASADNLTSHSRLSVRGYQDRSLATSIAEFPTRLTVENYMEAHEALKAIQLKVSGDPDPTKVIPQLLAVRPDVAAAAFTSLEALATISALQSLAKRWKFLTAAGEIEERLGQGAVESARAVYRDLLGLDYETAEPSAADQDVARELLHDFELQRP
jgi:hypothetical protein